MSTQLLLKFFVGLLFGGICRAAEPYSSAATRSARVLIVQDPLAMDAFRPRPEKVRAMVARAITNFTGKATVSESWLSLVSTQDVVGIKVISGPGANSGTRPAVVIAVVEQLIDAGLPPKNVIVWDKQLEDLKAAGFSEFAKIYG